MATPATSSTAESTDTARFAHGRVRKKSRREVPPPREEGGGTSSVHHERLTGHEEPQLDERQQEHGDERQGEDQFDCCLALAPPFSAHFTLPVRLFMTASSSLPMRLVWVAQPTINRATA